MEDQAFLFFSLFMRMVCGIVDVPADFTQSLVVAKCVLNVHVVSGFGIDFICSDAELGAQACADSGGFLVCGVARSHDKKTGDQGRKKC